MATDWQDEERRNRWEALMAAGFGLLGAPKGQEGQALGRAGLLGLGTLNQGKRDLRRDRLAEEAERRSAQEYAMREQQWTQQQAAYQQAQQQQAAMLAAQQGAITPGQPGMPAMGPPTPQGEMQPELAAQPPTLDLSKYANNLLTTPGGVEKGIALQQAMQKESPFAAPKMEDFTPESRAIYPRTRDPGALVLATKPPNERWVDIPAPPGSRGQQWQQDLVSGQKRATGAVAPVTNVNVGAARLETEEAKEKGKLNVKVYDKVRTLAEASQNEQHILKAMKRNPLKTGRGVPLTSTAAAWLKYAGMDTKAINELAVNSEAFTANTMQLVLNKQIAQAGPQTESDAMRMQQTVAQARNTEEANAIIIDFAMRQNDRNMEARKFLDDWWHSNKTYEGADSAWFNGRGGQSLFDDDAPQQKGRAVEGKIGGTAGREPTAQEAADELRKRGRIR